MSKIEQLEKQIQGAKDAVALRDRVTRLLENPDFRDIILKGFCTDECARSTHISTDMSMSAEARADALGSAQAAGYLKRWLHFQLMMGNRAAEGLPEAEHVLTEARADPDAFENEE